MKDRQALDSAVLERFGLDLRNISSLYIMGLLRW